MNKSRFARRAVAFLILILILGDFSSIMISFDHNEQMYVAAGALIKQHQSLYSDFAFLQMPYLPLLYGLVYKLTGTTRYLLAAKCVSFLFFALSAWIVFLVARRVSKDSFPAAGALVLYLLNATVLDPATETSNYIMPIAFSFVGFYLYVVSANDKSIKPVGVLLGGMAIAMAIGAKLYYAVVVIPFIVTALCFPSSVGMTSRIRTILAPFMLGLLLGLLPVLCYAVQDPGVFLFNNLGYHAVNAQWRALTGFRRAMSLSSKIRFEEDILFLGENVLLLYASLVILALVCMKKRNSGGIRQVLKTFPMEWWLALSLFAVSIPTIVLPTPSFPQYSAMPVSFLFLVFVCSLSLIAESDRPLMKSMLVLCVLLALLGRGSTSFDSINLIRHKHNWEGFRIHKIARRMQRTLENAGTGGKLATLSPIYAVEANRPIYRELSTGPFLYRIGDLLAPEQRARVHGTSPATLPALLDRDPPSAIFVGFERGLDKPLREYAAAKNYQKVEGDWGGGELYIRGP